MFTTKFLMIQQANKYFTRSRPGKVLKKNLKNEKIVILLFFSFLSNSSKTGKYGIDGMQVFSAMSPARHFRYHAVTGSILIVAGIALIVKRPFGKDLKLSHLINFEKYII